MSLLTVRKKFAQDRGNYSTNARELLRKAIWNLETSHNVVWQAEKNIQAAMVKVKDEKTKASLKSMFDHWHSCERELEQARNKMLEISIPPDLGIPHKEKLSPADRAALNELFE